MQNLYACVGAHAEGGAAQKGQRATWKGWGGGGWRLKEGKLHVRHIDVFVYVNRKCCAAGTVKKQTLTHTDSE